MANERAENLEQEAKPVGVVVSGGLSEGLWMRLNEGENIEAQRVGSFLTIKGNQSRFFSMVSDIRLDATSPILTESAPQGGLAKQVIDGTVTFARLQLIPQKVQYYDDDELLPVKTVPSHFSQVFEATQEDVSKVFGSETEDLKFFEIGKPLDMDTPICLDMERWVERSNAIFGKSGTGKTFLTRICLCGAIHAKKAVHLIFDMHSEYGWKGRTEDKNRESVRGLKQYFGKDVEVFTLDPESSKRRGNNNAFHVQIAYNQIEVEDLMLLQKELNLTPTTIESCYLLEKHLKKDWFQTFLSWDTLQIKEFVEESGASSSSLSAMQRKFARLVKDCEGILIDTVRQDKDAVNGILERLHAGINVVLEFGKYDAPVQYMLVANILTRRIREHYIKETEELLGGGQSDRKPLVIVIEEAHKFLSPSLADQTIFGTIARELRKYNVTLLIIDQRPGGIDREILSQVGTKICCLLDDEQDIEAVLHGSAGARNLRNVLANLETRQQALIFGHAVPMPVVVRTRTYDDVEFRTRIRRPDAEGDETPEERAQRHADAKEVRDLF